MDAELRVLIAVRRFLSQRPGRWYSSHELFPDRKSWSPRKRELSLRCRWILERLSKSKRFDGVGIQSKPGKGVWLYRCPREIEPACVLDNLLGECANGNNRRRPT